MSTPQSQAIQVANAYAAAASQIMAAYNAIKAIDAQWTDQQTATTLNALSTAPMLANGTPGTADTNPVVTNPIDIRIYGPLGLQHAISANGYASLKTTVDSIVTFVEGGAVSANAGARQILNGAIGG